MKSGSRLPSHDDVYSILGISVFVTVLLMAAAFFQQNKLEFISTNRIVKLSVAPVQADSGQAYVNFKYGFSFILPDGFTASDVLSTSDTGNFLSPVTNSPPLPLSTVSVVDQADNSQFNFEIFNVYPLPLSPQNYYNHQLGLLGSCDRRWLQDRPGYIKTESINGRQVLVAKISQNNTYWSCYFFKNKFDQVIIASTNQLTDRTAYLKADNTLKSVLSTLETVVTKR